MRSKLKEKKILIIAVITTIFIISAGLIYYFYFYKEKEIQHSVLFTLNEPLNQTIEYGEEYQELGAKVLVDNIDKSSMIKIDTENLNIKALGEYKIKLNSIVPKRDENYLSFINNELESKYLNRLQR